MEETPALAAALTERLEQLRKRAIASAEEPITIQELATKLGTSRAAIYMWLSGDRIPKPSHLAALAKFFAEDADEQAAINSDFLAALDTQNKRREIMPPSYLVSSEIADRVSLATDLWILKWQKRFRSGSDAFLYRQIQAIINGGLDAEHPRFNYVFPTKKVGDEVARLIGSSIAREDLTASRSFEDLESQLRRDFPEADLSGMIVGHRIEQLADVLRLGIPRAAMIGYFMIEYSAEGYDAYARRTDVFVEIDARQSVREVGARDYAVPQTYWVALPPELSEAMRADWKAVISEVAGRSASSEAGKAAA